MKKSILILICIVFCHAVSFGQGTVVKKVEKNADLNEIFATSRYLFPEFQDVQIVFDKGGMGAAKMNYNLLSGQMDFVDTDGKILELKNTKDVNVIFFGKRAFKNTPKGFMEMAASDGEREVLIKRSIRENDRKKYGAYGSTAASSSAIDNVTNYVRGNATTALGISEEVSFKYEIFYHLKNGNKYRTANLSGFLKEFPKQKTAIETYIKQNPVNFNSEEDIIRLFKFCNKE